MSGQDDVVRTTLRIPGNWSHPKELIERMPAGCRLTSQSLCMPDGTEVEFTPLPPDDEFSQVFRIACRRPATAEEMAIVDSYTVNIGLTGAGGSMEAARTMLRAGAAVVRAGGGGVFIDNSALAHGAEQWVSMAEDGGVDAVSFAFVSLVRGRQEVFTVGMHVMGLPDVVMKRGDLDDDGEVLIEVILYLCHGEKPVGDGHVLADELGPRFQAVAIEGGTIDLGTPMHNPFGRLKLVSYKDLAEKN